MLNGCVLLVGSECLLLKPTARVTIPLTDSQRKMSCTITLKHRECRLGDTLRSAQAES